MRTSLNEIAQTEAYLSGKLKPSARLLFEARLLVSPALAEQVKLQKVVLYLTTLFGRKQLKKEIDTIHRRLFTDPDKKAFQEKVIQIFNKA